MANVILRAHIASTGVKPRIRRAWATPYADGDGDGSWGWKIVNIEDMSLGEFLEAQYKLICWARDRELSAHFDAIYKESKYVWKEIFLNKEQP